MTFKQKVGDFIKSLFSRKFIAAMIAAVVAFGNAYWDWGLTTEEVSQIITPLLAFVGVEGLIDFRRAKS